MPKQGYITPSRFKDVMTEGRGKSDLWGLTALTYARQIVMDVLGVQREEITAKSLEWGNTFEYEGRAYYEASRFVSVPELTEPIFHPDVEYVCGIPDGLVGDDGIIEIKCPFNPDNHLLNIKEPLQANKEYKWQIQGYLWITERDWCDFVSYHPNFPDHIKCAIHRIDRDQNAIDELAARCELFWNDIVQPELKKYLP